MNDYFLSIDCGTQSLRAIVFDCKGKIIDKQQIYYEPYFSIKPGYAEQYAEKYIESLCYAVKELKVRIPKIIENIKSVAITTLRDTMVQINKCGEVIRPIILWLDQRKADIFYKPNFFWDLIFRAIGIRNTLDKMQKNGKSNWLRQFEKDNWEKTYKYLMVSGYLNYFLTGEFVDSIASQIGHIPFDYKKQDWANVSDPLNFTSKLYPIEKEKLAELVKPGEIIGKVTYKAAELTGLKVGTPVIAAGSDKGCETIGMGVIDGNKASLSFGTTATIQTTLPKYVEPITFMPAYPAVIPNSWNPEIEIYRGYWMIRWFKTEFAHKEDLEAQEKGIVVEEILNSLLEKSPAGSFGLVVQPYWTPGLGDKNAKGAMIGFGDIHKKEHIYRAVIEGLAYGLKDGKEKLEKKTNLRFKQLCVSGGASQSNLICQITADVFNMPLYRGQTFETSGLGAAIISAFGTGVYQNINDAIDNMVHYKDVFEPNLENVAIYKELYENIYLKIYKTLEPLYVKIRKLTNYPEL